MLVYIWQLRTSIRFNPSFSRIKPQIQLNTVEISFRFRHKHQLTTLKKGQYQHTNNNSVNTLTSRRTDRRRLKQVFKNVEDKLCK